MKKLPEDFEYLRDMSGDDYYPPFLVEKVKDELKKVAAYLQEEHTAGEIQKKFDTMTEAINDLEEEFYINDSELETVAREDIAETVQRLIDFFGLEMDCETAIRNRDW